MNKKITLCGLAIFLCACSSHNTSSTASIQGLSPTDADRMSAQHATIKPAPPPQVTADTRFAAGQLAEAEGDYSKAIHQYKKALDLDPKHLPSLCRLGALYAQLKDYDTSIETWKRYIAASGNAPWAYGNLGYCYELAGYPDLAKATYQKGIDLDPHNAPCRTNYGIMLARDGKIAEALRMWSSVLTEGEIHYNLASVYQTEGRKEEAKGEFQKALECDPSLIDARSRLSQLDLNQ
jgi:tetratricopeptide (TPR) repeat protein